MCFFRNKFILHGSAFIKSDRIVRIIHVKRAEEPLTMLKLIPRKNITINGLKFSRDPLFQLNNIYHFSVIPFGASCSGLSDWSL